MVTEFVVKVVSTPHAPHPHPKKWSQCGVRCVHTTLHQLSGATPKIVKKVVCFPPRLFQGVFLTFEQVAHGHHQHDDRGQL